MTAKGTTEGRTYESYLVNKNQNIYLAFVDFSEHVDIKTSKLLSYKLLKYGIIGHVYHIIKSMYDDTKYTMKIRDRCSPSFRATSSVKQDCSMRPILSNMYQNDLHLPKAVTPFNLGNLLLTAYHGGGWWGWGGGDLLFLSTSKNVIMIWRVIVTNGAYRWTHREQSARFLITRLSGQTNSSFMTLF